jgi:trans-aconitate methyltransferase
MANSPFITSLLEPYQPKLPLDDLVVEVNKLYHSFEAQSYDVRHPEVHQQLPPLWQEIIKSLIEQQKSTTKWRILDFGCGTGFEAEQLIQNLPQGSIAQLICYDPSTEMLERCRSRIAPLFPEAIFCCDLKTIPDSNESYNLLATNSLLHHLPNFITTINSLLPLLSKDAVWLSGHEPSSRFYKNVECTKMYEQFLQERRIKKFLSPENYIRRIKRIFKLEIDPANETAKEAFYKGLFQTRPPVFVIGRLVDFHVAHSIDEAASGRGLDFESMQTEFAGTWKLTWVKTYSFMGSFYEQNLPQKWLESCGEIAYNFPHDGANFCSVWRRA